MTASEGGGRGMRELQQLTYKQKEELFMIMILNQFEVEQTQF